MKSETRLLRSNRVPGISSLQGSADGSKDTPLRDFKQQSAARLAHKQGSRAKRVASCLIRADLDKSLRQLCIHAHAARQRLATGDPAGAHFLIRRSAAFARFAEGCASDLIEAIEPRSSKVDYRDSRDNRHA